MISKYYLQWKGWENAKPLSYLYNITIIECLSQVQYSVHKYPIKGINGGDSHTFANELLSVFISGAKVIDIFPLLISRFGFKQMLPNFRIHSSCTYHSNIYLDLILHVKKSPSFRLLFSFAI